MTPSIIEKIFLNYHKIVNFSLNYIIMDVRKSYGKENF